MRRSIATWIFGLCLLALMWPVQAKTLVWRVAGAHNTVYLAGAMHLLPERAYPLPDAYEVAYDAARILVVEADQAKLAARTAQRRMLSAARYAQGDLKSHIGSDLYQRVRRAIAETDVTMARVDRFRPWFVSMTLEMQAYRAAAFKPDLGLDSHFSERARADGKAILPLTPIDAHLAVFTEMPGELSRDLLVSTLENADDLADSAHEIYGYWSTGDARGLAASVREQASAYPALYDRLIYDRNNRWMGTLKALLASPDDAMVLVGAVHLVGRRGLAARLRRAGYTVERVD